MTISKTDLQKIEQLRREIHKHPELSGKETETAKRIVRFVSYYDPDEIITGLGGNGIAVIFNGKNEGPSVMLRSELDALPIEEINDFDYASVNDGVGHKCGHDGHMSILSGVATQLSKERPQKGRVILLFQPAEEIGAGADLVLNDPKFEKIIPDYVFALHNLPDFEENCIILKEGSFAAASTGMIIKLTGKTSHAASPETGVSPANAVGDILKALPNIPAKLKELEEFCLVTPIHARLGEVAFGTSPGYAEVMATLRAFKNSDMEKIRDEAITIAEDCANRDSLKIDISWTETFPATSNHPECAELIESVANENGLKIEHIKESFRWSEDFGHFTSRYKGAFFGIGAGREHPSLHNPDFDFNHNLIPTGISMFMEIVRKLVM